MSEPSGLEYSVRDRHRTVVVPCQPVEHLTDAAKDYADTWADKMIGNYGYGSPVPPDAPDPDDRAEAAWDRLQTLLGRRAVDCLGTLPSPSNLAVAIGLVKRLPCSACSDTGKRTTENGAGR